MHSRRSFIKSAAMAMGATGVATGVPEAIQKAFAIDPVPGSTWKDAEHVVILMQENRSFDHALGSLQGVRGFNDPRAIRQANGNSIFLQTSASGETYVPWRLDIKDTRITWMGSLSHARNTQVDAWNHGHHNNWIETKRSGLADAHNIPMTMGHYTREDLPFYYALADAFTVCDQNYCGVMTSTTPNRSLLWTGTVRSEQNPHSSVYMRNDQFWGNGGLKWKTFPERLQDAGVSWKIYQNEIKSTELDHEESAWLGNVGNVVAAFSAFNLNLHNAGSKNTQQQIIAANAKLKELKESPLGNDVQADRDAEIKETEAHLASLQQELKKGGGGDLHKLPPRDQELHMRAFVTNAGDDNYHKLETISFEADGKKQSMKVPAGDVLHQFRKDVEQGHLPTVSWLVPPGAFSDHPSHPWFGAWYLSEVVNILTHNPDVWKKTIFIMTYDENDGYFDHAPSYVAADPQNRGSGRASAGIDTALEYSYAPDELAQGVKAKDARSGPIGLGYRVPMIVASPWSRGGYVNSQLFDQTSTLQFMEKFIEAKSGKQVREENLSAFRRAILGDMTSVFRPFDAKVPDMPFHDRNKFVEGIQAAKNKEIPTNFKKVTDAEIKAFNENPRSVKGIAQQEPGTRPANALPYEMYCEGDFNPTSKVFGLAMRAGNAVHGDRSAGVPYNVYFRNTAKASGVAARGADNVNMFVATYAVKAGDTLQEGLPQQLFKDGKYEVHVHAPNGFYREFSGDGSAPAVVSRCVYEKGLNGTLTGNVEARLKNVSANPITVTVADNSYKTGTQVKELKPGEMVSVRVDLQKQRGWYDFTVQTAGLHGHVRYAGRVETGRESITDPLMGGTLA